MKKIISKIKEDILGILIYYISLPMAIFGLFLPQNIGIIMTTIGCIIGVSVVLFLFIYLIYTLIEDFIGLFKIEKKNENNS